MAKTILVMILKMFHKLTLDIVTVVVVVTLVVNKMKILTLSIFTPPQVLIGLIEKKMIIVTMIKIFGQGYS